MYNENNFLKALSQSFKNYLEHGARSTEKLKLIHLFLAKTLQKVFGKGYEMYYLGENTKELTVEGKYYPKDIDITVTHNEKPVFCLGLKFVTSNYKQNANNYFEGMMGETANIQRQNIPYSQVIVLRHETPYYKKGLDDQKDKTSAKNEIINQKDLSKYVNLMFDTQQAHRPFAIGILLVDINETTCQVKKIKPSSFLVANFAERNVRSIGIGGRIDILAYNSKSKRFVVFELKKDYDKNITEQAADYRDCIDDNFADVYLKTTQQYNINLPKFQDVLKEIEIVLIAKRFSITQIERVKKNKENNITLIKYFWFEDDLIFIDYLNNDPDEEKIENIDSKKVRLVKEIVNKDPDLYEIDRFFNLKQESKDVFLVFYEWLKTKGSVVVKPRQVLLKVEFGEHTFSAIGYAGKVASKQVLQINTNIDLMSINQLLVEDRVREGQKKKGSLASERFEIRLKNKAEMEIMINALKDKI
ncbi:hypothetical protein CHS0354_000629 [Potamilus streckersoni]|uniref:Uncharacterized protein n=1 Tax=Potamilus streckersoni TaxID=2493646 RepID=A0AAE0W9A3_9BIVA|nr:hypothetical protein CHS0354_000629 [Potamilus streckersoni]